MKNKIETAAGPDICVGYKVVSPELGRWITVEMRGDGYRVHGFITPDTARLMAETLVRFALQSELGVKAKSKATKKRKRIKP